MGNLLTTFGDEIFVVMPASISMPVPWLENIIPNSVKSNYWIVYVDRNALLSRPEKKESEWKPAIQPDRRSRCFLNVFEEKRGTIELLTTG
jgi:hypothetical protein